MRPPAYFEKIRIAAARRWDQLEGDPELAGPWHQLFKQVQSPRHVVSELLQNADDAGATEASAWIQGGCFTFNHNGEDFTEEHFASLCRFAHSNKRTLHTIGFRGIGFKSTFSLGSRVELYSPTLSVAFHRRRFTEPQWIESPMTIAKSTRVRVEIEDEHRRRELEKNLNEWLRSPGSLLFFKHIRRLRVGDQEVHWDRVGPGPVRDSEWMSLHTRPGDKFLIVRSAEESFPKDALEEIKQERLLSTEQDSHFPPCRVEIVLGAKGQLYVVLPTGVETTLPFASNAPFIQDPARLKIKDPETSPTNRWLLARVGALAASTMLSWLRSESSPAERSVAYGLFPDSTSTQESLESSCTEMIDNAFTETIRNQPILLTETGALETTTRCVHLPEDVLEVWTADQATNLLDIDRRVSLSRYVSPPQCEKLSRRGVLQSIDKAQVLSRLQSARPPRPDGWHRLLKLWAYLASEITGYWFRGGEELRILPVQGRNVLYSKSEVVRLGEKKLLQSDEDWEFLSPFLLVINQNWLRFLGEQRRSLEDYDQRRDVDAAIAVLERLHLGDASDVSDVIDRVAREFFRSNSVSSGCIKLAQIAAKLGATTTGSFRFMTRDRFIHPPDDVVLFDRDGTLEGLFSESWCASHLLHPDYTRNLTSCTHEEWMRWIDSGQARLAGFPPLEPIRLRFWRKTELEEELTRRGANESPTYAYKNQQFHIEDWDFTEDHWRHWSRLVHEDPQLWTRLVERILDQGSSFWSRYDTAQAVQFSQSGSKRAITHERLLPTWILKLRDLPCLPNTRGSFHKPGDLLRRTPETEPFLEVEPFVHRRLDREITRPLLELLGVRDRPTGADRLLDCLRALSRSDTPPVHEVDKWYWRLDQLIENCATEDLSKIKQAFAEERIVLTESSGWARASEVFLLADEEDVPGAAIVRAAVRDLMLWQKLGIPERPTADLAIHWLSRLASGNALPQRDAKRVRALLARHPKRIWEECQCWLNLAGEWAPVSNLSYAVSMQSLTPWTHLHEWVKQRTADLRNLASDVVVELPFRTLPPLSSCIQERFQRDTHPDQSELKSWLNILGAELQRIVLDDASEQVRIRGLAQKLACARWRATAGLEVIPYIDGTPAGTPRRAEVIWLDQELYVNQISKPKLAKLVPEELGRHFGRSDIKAALDYAFERSPEDVRAYVEENFELVSPEAVAAQKPAEDASTSALHEATAPNALPGEMLEPESSTTPEVSTPVVSTTVETLTASPRQPKLAKPTILERFATVRGFRKLSDDRFVHSDGSSITRSIGSTFPWERQSASGTLLRFYWPKDHCLEIDPLELDSEVWGLLEQNPERYALVLSNAEGEPVERIGTELLGMRDRDQLTLYPASYRVVLNDGRRR